ncbi:MAG: hypothetical protein GY719_35955 [bacterium]|nr:hypothetical protein [bacterium]
MSQQSIGRGAEGSRIVRRRLLVLALSCFVVLTAASLPNEERSHLAIGSPAAQSSTFERAVAGRAVDGELDGEYTGGSVSLTHRDPYPYWWVDLGGPVDVGSVIVHGRTDAFAERLDRFILIGLPDGASPATEPLLATLDRRQVTAPEFTRSDWTIHRSEGHFTDAEASEVVPLEGTFRYIYVMLPRADYLQLAEVEVLPPKTGE